MVNIYYFISVLAILSVYIPLIKNDNWTFRVFDYPRFQKLFIVVILLIIGCFFKDSFTWFGDVVLVLLSISIIYLLFIIIPYSPFGKKMLLKADKNTSEDSLSLLVANIYQDNRNYTKTLDLINNKKSDVVFLLETDQAWCDALQSIKSEYPYFIEIPKPNTYGLLFYSKYPIQSSTTNYLIDQEIPSIIVDLDYNGRTIRLYGLHPTPPVPQENPKSTDRDAEILMIGKWAKEYKNPCIVMGDLNDVAWSYTTRLFLRISGLLDPRRGRGMYSTFHAKYLFLRWPLDHFFVSSHFRLLKMKVEKSVDSDHFPISISLVLRKEDKDQELEASIEDQELADEKIEKAFD